MHAVLKNDLTNDRKICPVGFSWTMLFFGPFVPLFRGDIKNFFLQFLLVLPTFAIYNVVCLFTYNKAYINKLLFQGYTPADEASKNILMAQGIYFHTPNEQK